MGRYVNTNLYITRDVLYVGPAELYDHAIRLLKFVALLTHICFYQSYLFKASQTP